MEGANVVQYGRSSIPDCPVQSSPGVIDPGVSDAHLRPKIKDGKQGAPARPPGHLYSGRSWAPRRGAGQVGHLPYPNTPENHDHRHLPHAPNHYAIAGGSIALHYIITAIYSDLNIDKNFYVYTTAIKLLQNKVRV